MTRNPGTERLEVSRRIQVPVPLLLLRSAICVVVVALLAACGSSGGTASPAPSAAESASAPEVSGELETTGESASEAPAGADSPDSTAADAPAPGAEVAPGEGGLSDSAGTEAECPLSAADISAATSVQWEFREFQPARPLETDEAILTTVCGFVAQEIVDQFGDPAFLRTDVFTGADAVTRQAGFASTCAESGGVITASAVPGGVTCVKDGVAVEAQIGNTDRVVELLISTSDEGAAQFSPAWDQILAAVN